MLFAQSGTEFWLAPPEVTELHNSPGGEPIFLQVSSMGQASTVTVSQPANPGFVPIILNVAANRSGRVNLTAFKTVLETQPTDAVLNTGLRIQSTTPITCYYEIANTNNTDIWALKGPNGLGTEFYIPLHKHAPFYNHTFAAPHEAYASFDIVATQNNTVVTIYSPVPVDGHPALQQFSVTLNQGQTYSCGYTGTGYEQPSTHPSGAVVLSDKPIAVSLKDDSNHNPSGGCYDLMGDQLVPVSIVGEDYIAVKGSLNTTGDESVIITATQNNTAIYLDGATTPVTTLFAGEYYRVDMDYLSTSTNNSVYIHATQPIYAVHVTGFGCESGMALLPPLNCAGSQQVNFVRSSTQSFFVTLLVRTAAVNNFTIQVNGGTATINPASFLTVPGTSGVWSAARIQYTTAQIPVDSTVRVTNTADVFALGIINGGATSGCRYGYFSEYVAPIAINAGIDRTICANATAVLAGSIAGGTTTGIWTTSGSGTFTPSNTALNATYTPSAGDASVGSVVLTLTSTGACIPVTDQMTLTITPAPTANAGVDQSKCRNNAATTLNGVVTVASGGVWTGGAGTFSPSNSSLNPVYTPTAAELTAGSVLLTLTTTGNGICSPVSDNMLITFTPSPVVNAGVDQTRCSNNPAATLSGSISGATGGVWTGGAGSYSPNATTLNAVYTATAAEIASGSITLTLTSTGNGTCNPVTDQMNISFTAAPQANAGVDITRCGNNAATPLGGSVIGATGGVWSGGLGLFSPNANTLNATYTPTAAEVAAGSVTLTLTTTGNGTCNAVTDQKVITYTASPTVNAGSAITICANNPNATLNGSFSVAGGAAWTGGAGTYSPNNTTMNAVYTPTAAEIATGSVTLTLTTTGNGSCNAVSSTVTITILPSPTVNAGVNIAACANNAAVTLNGQISNAGGGTWSGGGGTFSPNANSLTAIYTPTAAEIAAGSTTLTLTSTGNGSCNAVSDQMVITFAPAPVANAGIDQTVCGNNATVSLTGFVNFCAGGQWSGGLGLFSPSANSLSPTYTPTAGEVATGSMRLILTTTGNGTCNAVRDTMRINFTPTPTVDAGPQVTACANNSSAPLTGSFAIAGGVVWSGGAGSFSPSNTSTNVTYTPSTAEINAGGVTLYLTTTGNGTCLPVRDSVRYNINTAPLVNAGTNQTVCVSNLNVSLSGSVAGPTNTGTWTTLGSGFFIPNNNSLNAIYRCSAADSIVGSVELILTSTNNGSCVATSDTVLISILPAGTASAGLDLTVCGNNASVALNGVIGGGASGGTWTSNGTGIFLPNNTTLNALYVPSGFDIANGGATLKLTANSCNPAFDSLILTITPAPVVNAGGNKTICADSTSVPINGSVSGGSTTGIWTTTGSGTFSPSNSSLNATYIPSAADVNAQVVYLILTSTGNGNCVPDVDSIRLNIYPQGIVAAGPDQILCSNNANVVLNGSITGGATQGQWTSTGSGVFVPNDTALTATYIPSSADLIAGTVSLVLTATNSCNTAIDFINVIFTPAPTVDAGPSQSVCGTSSIIILNGTVNSATGAVWSGGSGTFTPSNTALNATYTPTAAERTLGYVLLTLTSTGNGSCNSVSDTVTHYFSNGIVVNAGPNQSVCRSASLTQMFGSVASGSTTGVWSTLGSGTFAPNDSALNALYTFSSADTASGSVQLILTSTNNGSCPIQKDTLTIIFGQSAFAFAGNDLSVCSSDSSINLNGLATGGATQGIWTTTGGGNFIPNDSILNATYRPSLSDFANGLVTFVLATTDHGSCLPGVDTVVYTLVPISQVSAGGDVTVCSDNLSIPLGGNVTGASGNGTWTTTGSGTFIPDNTTLNATYIASASDSLTGSVQLILTAENTGACAPASDTMTITIAPPAIVNAGSDQTTCASGSGVVLSGVVSGGSTTGQWSSTGSGTFSPSNTDLNATYTPSLSDAAAGSVQIILTSTNSGICIARTDTMLISISPSALVAAGPDRVVCGNNTDVLLNGLVSGTTTTGIWTTSGSGNFTPNAGVLNANYTMSAADILAGSVNLFLTSTNNGTCPAVVDTIIVTVEQLPTAAFNSVTEDSLEVSFTDQSSGAVSWLWDFGATGTATSQNPTYTYPAIGEYSVTLIITSAGGCSDTATAVVSATEQTLLPVAFPTGFSPNGDANNDVLHVLGGPFETVDFRIYNEWGNQIFSTTDPESGWDGTYRDKAQPAGVYIYTVTGVTIDGRTVNLSGNVTLIR